MDPNFFIVGAPKCGTTALYSYLQEHPDVFLASNKEPHYFCFDLRKQIRRHLQPPDKSASPQWSKRAYRGLFAEANQTARGEASVRYIFSEDAPAAIKRHDPHAKIIILLREPVSFLHSYHNQLVRNSEEDIVDFPEALDAEEDRARGKRIPDLTQYPTLLLYSRLAKFSSHIARYRRVFPDSQMKIVLLDDLRDRPEETYREVLSFLGVDTRFTPESFSAMNENRNVRFHGLNAFLKRPDSFPKPLLRRLLSDRLQRWAFRSLQESNQKDERRESMDPELRRRLMRRYSGEVRRLSHTLGRDLVTLWGYDNV